MENFILGFFITATIAMTYHFLTERTKRKEAEVKLLIAHGMLSAINELFGKLKEVHEEAMATIKEKEDE